MNCPVCRASGSYCPRCGGQAALVPAASGIAPAQTAAAEYQLLPLESAHGRSIRDLGDILTIGQVVKVQSECIMTWLAAREGQRGIRIRQEASAGGRLRKRTLRASIILKTW